jgi:hydrogenase maturation factor
MRRDPYSRRILYSAGYRAALIMAHADLDALAGTFERNYVALQQEVEELRREVAELRAIAGVRDPALPLN